MKQRATIKYQPSGDIIFGVNGRRPFLVGLLAMIDVNRKVLPMLSLNLPDEKFSKRRLTLLAK